MFLMCKSFLHLLVLIHSVYHNSYSNCSYYKYYLHFFKASSNFCMDLAMKKAKETGVGWVTCHGKISMHVFHE